MEQFMLGYCYFCGDEREFELGAYGYTCTCCEQPLNSRPAKKMEDEFLEMIGEAEIEAEQELLYCNWCSNFISLKEFLKEGNSTCTCCGEEVDFTKQLKKKGYSCEDEKWFRPMVRLIDRSEDN